VPESQLGSYFTLKRKKNTKKHKKPTRKNPEHKKTLPKPTHKGLQYVCEVHTFSSKRLLLCI